MMFASDDDDWNGGLQFGIRSDAAPDCVLGILRAMESSMRNPRHTNNPTNPCLKPVVEVVEVVEKVIVEVVVVWGIHPPWTTGLTNQPINKPLKPPHYPSNY